MSKSYVDDISQFLDLANRENVRILAGKTLIWNIINSTIFIKIVNSPFRSRLLLYSVQYIIYFVLVQLCYWQVVKLSHS